LEFGENDRLEFGENDRVTVHAAEVTGSSAVPERVRLVLPGLGLVTVGVLLAFGARELIDVSPLVAAVVIGAVAANLGLARPMLQPGIAFAARSILRAGIVLLGLRLSFDEVRALGVLGAACVVAVVLFAFFGIQLVARRFGLSSGFGLLIATGYSICGASAVAAMEPLSGADEEETAYAIGLVTLCGTLSIFVLPVIGHAVGLSDEQFGFWVGAGVHDVGQVTATATAYSAASLATATLVKLTRVVLLAALVFGVGVAKRREAKRRQEAYDHISGKMAPIVPLFVVLFLGAIALRATGWLSDEALELAIEIDQVLLTAGMFGLGAGVDLRRLRRLGGRPLAVGLASWVVVAGAAYAAAVIAV
jgi:uncharacterized integral membrane protein (TIGR00698 family)